MLAEGTVLFDKYRVERVIGEGGMACVVAARHLQLGEPVAIKMLLPEMAKNPTVVQRFLREARAAVRLKGEHVTRVLDVGTLPWGAPYMVMELLVGVDLAQLLKEHGRLPASEAVDCVLQVCEALAEAHAAGIVHRDIKPSNLFVTRRPDGSPLVKVLDFGISKVAYEDGVSNLTMESVLGTPSYMSPEQLRGSSDVDARTDIWSLGIVLYRLLSGVRPFKADSLSALAIQAATEPTPPLLGPVPPGLDAVVYRCLEKDVAARFQSVAELAFALGPHAGNARAASIVIERTQNILRWVPPPPPAMMPVIRHEPTTLGSSVGAIQPPTSGTRGRASWVLAGGAVLGAIIAIAVIAGGGGESPRSASGTAAPAESTESTESTGSVEPAVEAPSVELPVVEAPAVQPSPGEPPPVEPPRVAEPPIAASPAPAEPTTKPVPEPAKDKPRHDRRPRARRDVKPAPAPTPASAPKPADRTPANPLDTRM